MTSSQGAGTGTGAAPAPPGRMTKAKFQQLYDQLRAQPSWGPADRRGALNYITPATMLAAVGEVKLGRSVSMAGPIEYRVTADNPEPCQHKMTHTGDSAPDGGLLDRSPAFLPFSPGVLDHLCGRVATECPGPSPDIPETAGQRKTDYGSQ